MQPHVRLERSPKANTTLPISEYQNRGIDGTAIATVCCASFPNFLNNCNELIDYDPTYVGEQHIHSYVRGHLLDLSTKGELWSCNLIISYHNLTSKHSIPNILQLYSNKIFHTGHFMHEA